LATFIIHLSEILALHQTCDLRRVTYREHNTLMLMFLRGRNDALLQFRPWDSDLADGHVTLGIINTKE
jgi:hypothetical protein